MVLPYAPRKATARSQLKKITFPASQENIQTVEYYGWQKIRLTCAIPTQILMINTVPITRRLNFLKNGQWITIDARLIPKGPLLYEASNQEDPLGFDIKRKSSYIITPDGRTYFNDWKLYGENGSTETLLATADWTHYTVGDDGIAIKNIFPGIDAEMKVSRGSIKTNFIVHANKFPSYKTLLFRDSFLGGHPGNFTFSNGLPGNGLASSADFHVSAGTVFHVKEGVMYQKK